MHNEIFMVSYEYKKIELLSLECNKIKTRRIMSGVVKIHSTSITVKFLESDNDGSVHARN